MHHGFNAFFFGSMIASRRDRDCSASNSCLGKKGILKPSLPERFDVQDNIPGTQQSLHTHKISQNEMQDQKDTAMQWLARSMGIVDTLCCYSYSKEQLHTEEATYQIDTNSSGLTPPSWMCEELHEDDQDDICVKERPTTTRRIRRSYTFEEAENRSPSRRHHHKSLSSSSSFSYFDKDDEEDDDDYYHSPGKSVSTASTITTSTTTTVRTSSRSPRHFYQQPKPCTSTTRAPPEISLPLQPDSTVVSRPIRMRPVPSNALPGVPLYSSTEGYQC